MRPLPIQPVIGMPDWLRGVAIIRGKATPVVDLGAVIGGATPGFFGRFITLKIDERTVALAVDGVVGVSQRQLPDGAELPPLLRNAGNPVIEAVGTLDAQLLLVLQTARLVPEEVWQALRE